MQTLVGVFLGVHPNGSPPVPKVSVYLPDPLYQRARDRGLKLSALTQAALEQELSRDPNVAWIREVRERAPRLDKTIDTSRLLDDVHDEFGS